MYVITVVEYNLHLKVQLLYSVTFVNSTRGFPKMLQTAAVWPAKWQHIILLVNN